MLSWVMLIVLSLLVVGLLGVITFVVYEVHKDR